MKLADGYKIYKLTHTDGYPLSLTLHELAINKIVVDWESYFKEAIEDGIILENEYRRVLGAIAEAFDDKYLAEFKPRLQLLLLSLTRK